MRISDWSSDVCSSDLKKTSPDGYRISVVYYALQGLKDCHTFAEETAYARRRRAEREDDLGANGFKGPRILTTESRPSPGSADRRGPGANPTPVPTSEAIGRASVLERGSKDVEVAGGGGS